MLTNAILRHGLYRPEHPAVADAGGVTSHGELRRRTLALAGAVHALGLRPGDCMGVWISNRREQLEAMLAAAHLGLIAFPMDTAWTAAEAAACIGRFGLRGLVAERAGALADLPPAALAPLRGRIICIEPAPDALTYAEVLAAGHPVPPGCDDPEAVSVLSLSSGSTGAAKAIALTTGNLLHRFFTQILEFGLTPADRLLVSTPLYYGAARSYALNCLLVGGTVHLLQGFQPAETLAQIAAHRITVAFTVPTQLRRLLQAPQLGQYDTGSLKVLICSGASLDPETRRAVLERITPNLYEVYASTEAGALSILHPADQAVRPTSVGRPLWNTCLRIVDAALQPVAPGQEGEILCQGPAVARGYFQNPAATAEAFADGWYRTGDIGRMEADGYLYITGRIKEMVISGGRNVYPAEVEAVLLQHPDVVDAAVIGLPDPDWGETVWACVVPRADRCPTAEALTIYCRDRLAPYKVPKGFRFLETLPKGPTGKVDRRALCERNFDKSRR